MTEIRRTAGVLLAAAVYSAACAAPREPTKAPPTAAAAKAPASVEAAAADRSASDSIPKPVCPVKPPSTNEIEIADPEDDKDLPIIAVVGEEIRVNGSTVGDTEPILTRGRPTRVDGLFDNLKASRERWTAEHPG